MNLAAYCLAVATFGKNLKRIRKAKGLTQEKLAELLHYKRPAPIAIWETTNRLPRPYTIYRVAAVLKVSTRELMLDVPLPHERLRNNTYQPEEKARADVPAIREPGRRRRASS